MDALPLFPLVLVVLLVSDGLLVLLALYVYRRLRVVPPPAAPDPAPQIEALRQDMRGLAAALGVLGQRLARVEELLERQQERGAQASGGRGDSERRGYEIATRLAARGCSADELVELCGLGRGEAELVLRLHGPRDERQHAGS